MYEIKIVRSSKEGVLEFKSPNKTIKCKCYWDLSNKIPAGTYKQCSATTMNTKKNSKGNPREAIFIANVPGHVGIFIHMGKAPFEKWSDGCIVIEESKIIEIYNSVSPKNGKNITVTIIG